MNNEQYILLFILLCVCMVLIAACGDYLRSIRNELKRLGDKYAPL